MSIRQAKERLLLKLKMMDLAHKMAGHSKLRFGPPEGENMIEEKVFNFSNHNIIGTCSLCGGPVTVPIIWHGIYSPTPTCQHCKAYKKEFHGPVIDMEPPKFKENK